jgi:uncharacterized OB-fold protein
MSDQGPDATYQAALDRGEFRLQRCGDCGGAVFPPRVLCSHCGGASLSWHRAEGLGTVYSCTTVRMQPKGEAPYNVSLIDLDEGVRLMSSVTGIPSDAVRIGQRVRALVEQRGTAGILLFVPVEDKP